MILSTLKHPAVALFLLRRERGYHCETVRNLHDIVEQVMYDVVFP